MAAFTAEAIHNGTPNVPTSASTGPCWPWIECCVSSCCIVCTAARCNTPQLTLPPWDPGRLLTPVVRGKLHPHLAK